MNYSIINSSRLAQSNVLLFLFVGCLDGRNVVLMSPRIVQETWIVVKLVKSTTMFKVFNVSECNTDGSCEERLICRKRGFQVDLEILGV